MMNKQKGNKKTLRQEYVEGAIRKSPLLPTMSFYQAKKYLNDLQNALVDPDDDYADNLKAQLHELCGILGVKEEDSICYIKNSRIQRTSLNCKVSEVPEYINLICDQLRYDISDEAKAIIRQQLAEADFVTRY